MSCCTPQSADVRVHGHSRAFDRASRDIRNMAAIPAGLFQVGCEGPEAYHADGEGPVRRVATAGFLIDRAAVTNAAFAKFVAATGYVTEAEEIGWSFVFAAQVHPRAASQARPAPFGAPSWWAVVPGASWSRPDGPGSSHLDRHDHPCVHVSWNDAVAYADWAGKRLPTEDEWEIAARGGLEGATYPWGDELEPGGEHRCNIWQGRFPDDNTADDGWLSTAPAESYAPNGYGLFNMVGNIWEWTAGRWSPGQDRLRAMRGGSYLCHDSYCRRYRVSARTANTPDSASSHVGFRCVADLQPMSA